MLTTTNKLDPIALDAQHVLQIYKRASVVFESGKGCALFTTTGERYLDLLSGIGVTSLGHAHPVLARALADQAQTLLPRRTCITIRYRRNWPRSSRRSRACRVRFSATAARKPSRRA